MSDLEEKLTSKYKIMSEYLCNIRLKLNDDKTHMLVMTKRQKRRLLNINIKIRTTTEEISPIKSEKLLGIIIQEDLKWSDYIMNQEKSLIRQLTSRLSALKLIAGVEVFKSD